MFKRFLVFVLVAGLVFPFSAFSAVIGEFAVVTGDVTVTREGQTFKPKIEDNIQTNDFIATGENSNARIVLTDAIAMAVGPNSKIEMKQFTVQDGKTTGLFSLSAGLVQTNIDKALSPGSKFEIHTPDAIVGAKGTAWLTLVELALNAQSPTRSSFYAVERSVFVLNPAFPTQVATVAAGNFSVVLAGAAPTAAAQCAATVITSMFVRLGASAIPGFTSLGAAGAAGTAAGTAAVGGVSAGTVAAGVAVTAAVVTGIVTASGSNNTTPTHTTTVHH